MSMILVLIKLVTPHSFTTITSPLQSSLVHPPFKIKLEMEGKEETKGFKSIPVDILKHIVLGFVDYNYSDMAFRRVCKEWKGVYISWLKETKPVPSRKPLSRRSRKRLRLPNHRMIEKGINTGDVEVLQCMKNNGFKLWESSVFEHAAFRGNLQVMEWLLENGCLFGKVTFRGAARNGNLDNMKWLLSKGCPLDDGWALYSASRKGNLDNMKWLLSKGCPINENTFTCSARKGNLDNMKWLRSEGCPFDERTFEEASKKGNLDNMKWLLSEGCPWKKDTFEQAANNGNLDNMKWLLENNCPFDEWTFANAAKNGNLDNMKWLLSKGCPMNKAVFSISCYYNEDLETMKWLKFNGCPWDEDTFYNAWVLKNVEIMEWLKENGCPECENLVQRRG